MPTGSQTIVLEGDSLVAEEGRAAGFRGFYWKVGRRTPPTAHRSLVDPAGRIHSAFCGEGRRQLVGCPLQWRTRSTPLTPEATTARKTSRSPTSDRPWCLSTRRSYSVCALSLKTWRMWSDGDRLLLNTTPRISSELSRVTLGSGGGRVFNFPRPLSRKRTSLGFDLFSQEVKRGNFVVLFHVVKITEETEQ